MDTEKKPEQSQRSAARASMTTTFLDTLEVGTPELVEADRVATKAERKILPDGATSKILYRDIIRIAWPSLVEMMLLSLASMVDMMMVGGLGTSAVSAIGLAMQPRFIFISLIMAVNTGATAVIARARGAGDHERAESILKQSLFLSAILAVVGTVSGYYTSEALIRFMSAGGMSEETIRQGTEYLQIQMLGFGSIAFSSAITAALRGTGNSRVPMVYNIISNVVNVIFNWLLINGNWGFPRLEVAGASLATIIGQVVAMVMAFVAVANGKNYFHLRIKDGFKLDGRIIGQITKIGLPSLGEQAIMRIGLIIFTRTVSGLGEASMAIHQIALSIQSLSFNTGMALAVSSTTLVGQSLGRRRPDMAEHYSTRCRRVGLYIAVLLMFVFAVFGKGFVGLYSKDAQVLEMGAVIMLFVAGLQTIQSSQFILSGALRGAGDTKTTAIITFATVLAVRPALAWLLVNYTGLGIYGAWIAICVDQSLRSVLVLWRYGSGKWKHIKI